MILTYKILHNRDFATELHKAIKVAKYAISHKNCRTTKSVKHLGLKACISNQILKKYGGNKKIKNIHSVKLTINGYFIKVNQEKREINIPSLKLKLNYFFPNNFIKLNQIEIDNKYCYISVEIKDNKEVISINSIGVDRNTTGSCAVVAIPSTGKVIKLGKKAFHIHRKYKKIRQMLQKVNAKKMLKKIRKREKNIIKDINHKISKKIVEIAKNNSCNIKLEDLSGIRKNSKGGKNNRKGKNGESFKSSINTWEFYQLQTMIEYKSKICGIKVIYIDPKFTSQKCSKCGLIGNRNKKEFVCQHCGHVDHADSNAAFNIAASLELSKQKNNKAVKIVETALNECNGQLALESDNAKGNTDIPQLETQLIRKVV